MKGLVQFSDDGGATWETFVAVADPSVKHGVEYGNGAIKRLARDCPGRKWRFVWAEVQRGAER